MITAEEARQLAAESDDFLQTFLDKIEVLIRDAASNNTRKITLYVDGLWHSAALYLRPAPSLIQTRVMEVLRTQSFGVSYGADGPPYVPRGSSDNVEFVNWVITVSF